MGGFNPRKFDRLVVRGGVDGRGSDGGGGGGSLEVRGGGADDASGWLLHPPSDGGRGGGSVVEVVRFRGADDSALSPSFSSGFAMNCL